MGPSIELALLAALPLAAGARTSTASLEERAELEAIIRIALEKNPGLAELRESARAAEAREAAAGALPDLELKYEQWGVPLARPYALDRADTLMLGLRQSFPAGRAAEERAAGEE